MATETISLTPELTQYLRSVSVREPAALTRLREDTAKLARGSMQIPPEQGQFLRLLVQMMGVRKAVEAGTFTGYSSTCIALGMRAGGQLVCCDVSEEWTRRAREAWREAGVEDRIDLRIGPAMATLDALIAGGGAGTYDFAFLDADRPNNRNYIERVHVLLRPHGLCVIDNVLWKGRVIDPAWDDEDTTAVREFNAALYDDSRFSVSMLPVGDGITLAMKRS
jgi:caffeoyl-CoA O-methyltransferase